MAPSQILIVGGKPQLEAARELLPLDVITKLHDFATVNGRRVVVWTSASQAGEHAAAEIAERALAAGALDVRAVLPPAGTRPVGWDLSDARGEPREAIMAFAREHAVTMTPAEIAARRAPPPAAAIIQDEQTEPEPAPKPKRSKKPNVVALPSAPDNLDDDDTQPFRSRLMCKEDGSPLPKAMHNFVATLLHAPEFRGMFRKNSFTGDTMVCRQPPWDTAAPWRQRRISDNDITRATAAIERLVGLQPRVGDMGIAISSAAEARAFDPVREYLLGLDWDGVPRLRGGDGIDGWLTEYMGVRPSEFARIAGMRWLIAGVARCLGDPQDGTKADNMLIFEGSQGKRKSTALEILATMDGRVYFTDDVHDINGKDAVMQIQGRVIVEIAELDAFRSAEADAIKKWLSRKVDRIRLPYGRHVVDMPRRCIVAGTVNPSGAGYLKDPTGARRFWPVRVVGDIDLDRLRQDRDQLWAEAVHLYRHGEPWWLQPGETGLAEAAQALRYQEDAWGTLIDEACAKALDEITVSGIMGAIGIPVQQRDGRAQSRIVAHLKAQGYVRKRGRWTGWHYVKGSESDE